MLGKAGIVKAGPDSCVTMPVTVPCAGSPEICTHHMESLQGQAMKMGRSGQGSLCLGNAAPLDQADSLFFLTGACRRQKPLGAICRRQAGLAPLNYYQ